MKTNLNFPRMNFVSWFLIGYEECRLGYEYLLAPTRSHLRHLLPEYLKNLNALCYYDSKQGRPWPPNSWHAVGIQDFLTYASLHVTPFPYKDYRFNTPDCLTCTDPEDRWLCAWCGRPSVDWFVDALQDDYFCCDEHVTAHRRQVIAALPYIDELYATYPFRPLPVEQWKLKSYLNSLPSIFDGTLVDHSPVVLPVVECQRIQIVSTGKIPDGLLLESPLEL